MVGGNLCHGCLIMFELRPRSKKLYLANVHLKTKVFIFLISAAILDNYVHYHVKMTSPSVKMTKWRDASLDFL